ncbi:NADH-quinone oxidoreductase subunit L [Moraxella bovis]|uniref:NADH-quinone oxidoreductase subunit L n=1 Tax=Moraxella bovis TaxID=476 RepID=A0AAQ2QAC5_MORBO|nr:NADH-quinone oxidoreductase subunit L [Moraxella bovis]AWY20670.1 NADH-quinone oxidoreductase subunit L [Moraxella bovis]OOR92533.1 NADH-quinone oxidoreductase subunit L [Moraxella bovis]UYZ76652.1 NADH-quinone oxidoreductase subunit L [Moraxella bovis]UYZ77395.1 NADH-quinone oxidoreductase subunit L [Moraxella bovis]UYZ82125.1 NADH-quinone oxidoreductase subunit L [Moraxella bovis]
MNLLALTFIFPLIGFLILATGRNRISEKLATIIGVGVMGLSALTTAVVGIDYLANSSDKTVFTTLWTWFSVGGFAPKFGLALDGLSLTMTAIITGVGFLIHLFASWYMKGETGYARFFSYLNLFVASMLLLVQADNLLLLYLGWEGVGICSYLLIGFYYHNRANGRAAIKAFTVTRVGDVFLAIGLFLLFVVFGTLDMTAINAKADTMFAVNDPMLMLIVAMLIGGAFGKSAQIPLHTWLADAMAGPTPVSALIHAATMVTAGVYLIARMHPLFVLTPQMLLYWVGGIGALSMLVAGFCALAQTDIKRVLAYSTMSQLGYMFIALGVGAWQVAIFHLMTHAFFKALLFLASGAVIISTHHEQNIFKMGGLRKKIPLVFWSFVVGGGALVALPFVTVGFYSKEAILWETYATGHMSLFWAGVFGAFLTAVYTFRLIYLVFFGQEKTHGEKLSGVSYALPLVVLLVLSTGIGAWIHPPLANVLPASVGSTLTDGKHTAEIIAVGVTALGLALAYFLYVLDKGKILTKWTNSAFGGACTYWCYHGLGFDALYALVFVKPFLAICKFLKGDPVDKLWNILPFGVKLGNKLLVKTQTGRLGSHAVSFGVGLAVVLILAMMMVV